MLRGRVLPFVLVVAVSWNLATAVAAGTIYVDAAATGSNDGLTWTSAFTDLQTALAVAQSGDAIWVAAGVYRPTFLIDPSASFHLRSGVSLFGGFAGGESALDERDWEVNVCRLSGAVGGRAQSYHVVVAEEVDANTILDGFTIRDGRARSDAWVARPGGGILLRASSPTIRNCKILDNSSDFFGGGIANLAGGSPTFVNVTVAENWAQSGGGLYNDASVITISHGTFNSNGSQGSGGSIRNANGGTCILEDVDLDGFAHTHGGAMANYQSSAILRNVRVSGDAEVAGGGLANFGQCELDLEDVLFQACIAVDYAGGLLVEKGNARLTDVEFRNCITGGSPENSSGGAIYNAAADVELNRVKFVGCRTMGRGGAIASVGGAVTAINCEFLANRANIGGAIYSSSLTFALTNCSFASNTLLDPTSAAGSTAWSRGCAIFNSSSMILVNSILSGNVAPAGDAEMQDNGQAMIRHSLIRGCGASGIGWNAAFGLDQGGNLDLDPLYTNPVAGDLSLNRGSPAIDAGQTESLPPDTVADLAGNPRVVGQSVDIGAYEHQGSVPLERNSIGELKRLFGGQ